MWSRSGTLPVLTRDACLRTHDDDAGEARNFVRDKVSTIANLGVTFFINLVLGLIFYDSGNYSSVHGENERVVFGKVNAHFGALTFVAVGAMFGLSQVPSKS